MTGQPSTPIQVLRFLFFSSETVTVLLMLLAMVFGASPDGLQDPFSFLLVVSLPILSVAMLLFRFWIAGVLGLITTFGAFIAFSAPLAEHC